MADYIKSNLINIGEIKSKINSIEAIGKEFEDLIKELETILEYHPLIINSWALFYFNCGDIKKTEKILLKGLAKYPFNFDINYNLIEVYKQKNDLEKVFKFFAYSVKYALGDNKKAIVDVLNEYIKEVSKKRKDTTNINNYIVALNAFQKEVDYRIFPLYKDTKSMIRQKLFIDRTEDNYFLNMYKTVNVNDINENSRFCFKYEMLKGYYVKTETNLQKSKDDVIAISPIEKKLNLTFDFDGINIKKNNLALNKFTFFNIPSDNKVTIAGDSRYFISHFKSGTTDDKPKLVLYIFIDGLSHKFLQDNNVFDLMPKTTSFFSKGFMAENCHFTGEWTLPSVASISTGKYTINHNLFHNTYNYDFETHVKLIQEYFYDNGYMTAAIGDNWRSNPSYGYYKKINRWIYSPMIERMFSDELIMETIEHLECFKNFNNYLWLAIGDLHAINDGISNSPLSSLMEENMVSDVLEDAEKSVFKNYDPNKTSQYNAVIKKIDFYLGLLFDYINNNYNNDEVLIILNSDHGQSYIHKENDTFAPYRSNVPLMIKGRGVEPKISDEIISNVDILPTILSLCGINSDNDIDGQLMFDFGGSKREYAYMESIFPGQTYKSVIVDKEHKFYFETSNLTESDGSIDISDYTIKLINVKTAEDECDIYYDKINDYLKVVFEHVKKQIKV